MKRDSQLRSEAETLEGQLQSIQRRLRERLEVEFARGNLTSPQRLVMRELVRSQGLSVKELSARVSLAHSTVSDIVARLEQQGLVERKKADEDRRITKVHASAAVLRFMKTRMPSLTLTPLFHALERATADERQRIRDGVATLERLLGAERVGDQ